MKKKRRKLLSLVLVLALVFANFSGIEVRAEGMGETGTGKKSLDGASIELNLKDVDLEYDGNAKEPSVESVSVESASVETDCYEIVYSDNVEAGIATVTLKGKGDYEGSSSSTTFKISKRKITIKNIPAKDKTYDGSDTAELDFENVTFDRPLIANDDVKVTANGSFANKNAGDNKPVTIEDIKLTGNRAANYELNNKSLNTTANIKKRPLEIAWDDLSNFQFDGSQHKVMASITNKIENDEVELQYANNTASDVGDYTAKITRLTGKDAENYSLDSSTVEKKWSIGKASRTVEIKNNLDKTYDGVAVETPEIELSAGKGEENTVEYTYFDASGNPLEKAPKDAGTYKVKVTVNSKKYEEASIEKEFKINPKMVKVTVDNKEKIEGKEDPEFTYTMEGDVVQGDSLGITLTRDEGEKAGIYTIHATLSNKNYEVEITEGVFTIKASDKPTPGPSDEPTAPPTAQPTVTPDVTPTPTLTPTPAPTAAPDMKILQSPVDAEGEYFVPVGKEVELQITVENADKANLEYQWYCDGKKVDGNSDKYTVKLKKKGTVIYTCDIYNKVTKETKKEAGSWKVIGYKEKVSIIIKKTKKIKDILGKNVALSEIKVPKSAKKALTVNVKKGTIKMKKYCKNAKVTLVTKDGQSISITVTTAYPKPVLKKKPGALKTYIEGKYRTFTFKVFNVKGADKVVFEYSKKAKKGYKVSPKSKFLVKQGSSWFIRIYAKYGKQKSPYSKVVKIKG